VHTGSDQIPPDESWMQIYPPTNVPTYNFIAQVQPKVAGIYKIELKMDMLVSTFNSEYEVAVFVNGVYKPALAKRFICTYFKENLYISHIETMNANDEIGVYLRNFKSTIEQMQFGDVSLIIERKQ
jgi:hypothetical protein